MRPIIGAPTSCARASAHKGTRPLLCVPGKSQTTSSSRRPSPATHPIAFRFSKSRNVRQTRARERCTPMNLSVVGQERHEQGDGEHVDKHKDEQDAQSSLSDVINHFFCFFSLLSFTWILHLTRACRMASSNTSALRIAGNTSSTLSTNVNIRRCVALLRIDDQFVRP